MTQEKDPETPALTPADIQRIKFEYLDGRIEALENLVYNMIEVLQIVCDSLNGIEREKEIPS